MPVFASAATVELGAGDGAFSSVASSAKNIRASVALSDREQVNKREEGLGTTNAPAAPKSAKKVTVRENVMVKYGRCEQYVVVECSGAT
mmetsp:Transcript_13468/g.22396  ORF Transcript_13468/g.22396 Transcript_13468/m.22396 type:complete len:89 (+) Transcript_13468:779-1045(+)